MVAWEGHRGGGGGLDMYLLVMVSWVCTHVRSSQSAHVKGQCIVCQLNLDEAVEQKRKTVISCIPSISACSHCLPMEDGGKKGREAEGSHRPHSQDRGPSEPTPTHTHTLGTGGRPVPTSQPLHRETVCTCLQSGRKAKLAGNEVIRVLRARS